MKQQEYYRPEIESLDMVSENILCASKVSGIENETFGNMDEVEW